MLFSVLALAWAVQQAYLRTLSCIVDLSVGGLCTRVYCGVVFPYRSFALISVFAFSQLAPFRNIFHALSSMLSYLSSSGCSKGKSSPTTT